MKHIIPISLLIFTIFAGAQEINSEIYLKQKAELYSSAYEELDTSMLPEEDQDKFKKGNTPIEYCAEKAYYYYNELVVKFPNSKNYVYYLLNKGYSAGDSGKDEEAKKSLLEVIQITERKKSDGLKSDMKLEDIYYFQKRSLYYLVRINESKGNCVEAKYYVLKLKNMEKLKPDNLNEYQNDYMSETVERILRNCTN